MKHAVNLRFVVILTLLSVISSCGQKQIARYDKWPVSKPVLSEKDKNSLYLREIEKDFLYSPA